jgi:flagellar biosynthetic protein FlhB
MPDDTGERTEAPTPRRRQEARREGQIAKSQDLAAAIVFLAGLVALELLGPAIWGDLLRVMRAGLSPSESLDGGALATFSAAVTREMAAAVLPALLAVLVAALVVTYAQVGWLLTLRPLKPRLSKLSPLSGLKRIFSPRSAVRALMNFGKLALVSGVAYLTMAGKVAQIVHALDMDHAVLYVMLAELVFHLGLRLAVVMLVLALLDYAYQRYRHEKDLKMTKEEVKEELRRMEGDPVIKRRRRKVQWQLALQRLQSAVPKSDVVVSNPTHVAVALQYMAEKMNAPKVTAKGADYLALRIRQIAAAAGVPIVERRELARAMYDVVQVGHEIPEKFYQAVAEILAYVYELRRGTGPRPASVSGRTGQNAAAAPAMV